MSGVTSTWPKPTRNSPEKPTTESAKRHNKDSKKTTPAFMVFSVFSVTLWLIHLCTFSHVFDALAGDGFRVRSVVEYFDRNPARVVALFQCGEDRPEIDGAEAWPPTIRVVGVEVASPARVAADQVRHGNRLG